MAGLRDYRDFDAWKLANEVRIRVFRMTARRTFDQHQWLRTQLRKAANSACGNHGEGFARYRPKPFALFLETAIGSLTEILEHMVDVRILQLTNPTEDDEICSYARRARGAMIGLVRYLKSEDCEKNLRPTTRRSRRSEPEP
jgi:four helix bundle protein